MTPARIARLRRRDAALLLVALAACGVEQQPPVAETLDTTAASAPAVPAPATPAPAPTPSAPDTAALLARADSAVAAIARRDWATLAALTHDTRGVRFSPYGYVDDDAECSVTLQPAELRALAGDGTVRCWGHADGSGEPIRLPFAEYYERYVYDKDYRQGRRGAPDELLATSNTRSNIPGAFGPDAAFVAYHVPGTGESAAMNWGSLRVVFVPEDGRWRLVGIVHGQWTI